jgi:hypothetical protein
MNKENKHLKNTPGLLDAFMLIINALETETNELDNLEGEERQEVEEFSKSVSDAPFMEAVTIESNIIKNKLLENTLLVEAANAKDYDAVAEFLTGVTKLEKAIPGMSFELDAVIYRLLKTTVQVLEKNNLLSAVMLKAVLTTYTQDPAHLAGPVIAKGISAFTEEMELDGSKIGNAMIKNKMASLPSEMAETLGNMGSLINLLKGAGNKRPD